MADKRFVDTNILIYAHDLSAGRKHARAREVIEDLWATGRGVLSTQVLQELCVNLQRRIARPLPADQVRQIVQDYLSWEVVVTQLNQPSRPWRFKPVTRRLSGMP